MSSQAPPHICFYSARCRFSQNFLEQLSKTPWSREFRFVCVDMQPGKPRPALPPWLKAVPTLVIAGEPEPRKDAAVMNWISERKMRESGGAPKARSIRDGGGPMALTTALGVVSSEGLDAITDSLCSSGDEGFCFIGEDTSAGQGAMVRLAGNQVSLDDFASGSASGRTSGSGPGSVAGPSAAAMSAKAKALDDRMSAFQAERQRDMGPGRK
jgi:hypothetical protein